MNRELRLYEKNGRSLLIPRWLKVKQDDKSSFIAYCNSGDHKQTILTILLNSDIQDYAEKLYGENPCPNTPGRDLRRLRISEPYTGVESIIECVNWTGRRFFYWTLILYPSASSFAYMQIMSFGRFEKEETLWSEVTKSLQFDLSFDFSRLRQNPQVKVLVCTENNLFAIGPKEPKDRIKPWVPFLDTREHAQGFAATMDTLWVAIPTDCLECEVTVKEASKAPDYSKADQVFSVPITISNELYAHAVSGPVAPLAVNRGKYDVFVQLFKGKLKWRATLTFLPAGTVGARVIRLSGALIPKDVFIQKHPLE